MSKKQFTLPVIIKNFAYAMCSTDRVDLNHILLIVQYTTHKESKAIIIVIDFT